jgi:methionine biosynthesis protein MetW
MGKTDVRLDQEAIVDLIEPNAAVLDLGCGEGELLAALVKKKHVRAQGIEIDDEAILHCVTLGLNVFHDDIDRGLSEYSDQSFDYVILNQTFQQVRKPGDVLKESLRVGRKVIVGFPNFASLSTRYHLGLRGRTPVTPSLPYQWYDTPNLHFLSTIDFLDYCRKTGINVERSCYFTKNRKIRILPNLRADIGVYLISWKGRR